MRGLAILFFFAAITAVSAQDTAGITIQLTQAEVAVISQMVDRWPTLTEPPPPAYWDLQSELGRALRANPDALRAVLQARGIAR
jgi:hypothetical protein